MYKHQNGPAVKWHPLCNLDTIGSFRGSGQSSSDYNNDSKKINIDNSEGFGKLILTTPLANYEILDPAQRLVS